jgi:uncharacterized protein DUF2442
LFVDITRVEVVDAYRLRLSFGDGTVGDVDFSAREWRGVFEALQDPSYFARVEVDPEAGTITWPGGLDMAPEPLYDEARRNKVDAASAARYDIQPGAGPGSRNTPKASRTKNPRTGGASKKMERTGIEPVTSGLQSRRSPS